MARCHIFLSSAALCLAAAAAADAEESPLLVERGRAVAAQHCSRCHVIDEKNRFSGISSTPSFPLLVNALEDWEERFGSFHTRLPHPSVIRFRGVPVDETKGQPIVPVEIEFADIAALVAYARTLRKDNGR